MVALELLKNTRIPKDRSYQQAIEAMIRIREWTKDAVAQINTLQDEIERAHQLLDEVGVGHPEWGLSGRVVLMSFWMKNTPANARLLAALEVVEPHYSPRKRGAQICPVSKPASHPTWLPNGRRL